MKLVLKFGCVRADSTLMIRTFIIAIVAACGMLKLTKGQR